MVVSDERDRTISGPMPPTVWSASRRAMTSRAGGRFVGIGFIAALAATISSIFVKTDRGEETDAVLDALTRIEADVAGLKGRLDVQGG
jgi:hypothetical protein